MYLCTRFEKLSKAKGKIRHIVLMFLLTGVVSMWAQTDQDAQLDSYAAKYIRTPDAKARLKIANEFFAFLHSIDYIDEPIVFPDSAYIDSVDLNVYYYIAVVLCSRRICFHSGLLHACHPLHGHSG